MSYEILNKDLFSDDDPGKSSKRKDKIKIEDDENLSLEKKDKKKINFGFEMKPFYIHLGIIIIIILSLIIFFWSNISFDFAGDDTKDKTLILVGELNEFNKSINGNISVYSSEFELKYNSGTLNDESKDILIENFNGSIYLFNNSIIFDGIAKKISFSKNNINLNNNSFILTSKIKTTAKFIIPEIKLEFKDGRIMFGDVLNYKFENSTIFLNDFNSTMSYDGIFSFSGNTNEFNLNSFSDNLVVNYKK